MIENTTKEKLKLSTRQILLYLVDGLVSFHKPFDRHGLYRKNISDYFKWRDLDKKRFRDNLGRLKKEKIIKIYLENNQHILELTNKGKRKIIDLLAKEDNFKIPDKWDFKWRMVIFDIPDDKKKSRDLLRMRLKEIGFYKLQESVFVFPFDCKDYIDYLKDLYRIKKYVQYVIAEALDTQTNLISKFINQGLISQKMIGNKRKMKRTIKYRSSDK